MIDSKNPDEIKTQSFPKFVILDEGDFLKIGK